MWRIGIRPKNIPKVNALRNNFRKLLKINYSHFVAQTCLTVLPWFRCFRPDVGSGLSCINHSLWQLFGKVTYQNLTNFFLILVFSQARSKLSSKHNILVFWPRQKRRTGWRSRSQDPPCARMWSTLRPWYHFSEVLSCDQRDSIIIVSYSSRKEGFWVVLNTSCFVPFICRL